MKKNHRELVKALGLVSQLGITMVTPVVLCVAVGIWMDHKFSIHTTLIWLILGVLAGARSAYLMAKKFVTPGEEETLEQELRSETRGEKDKTEKGEKRDA
ncbi:MULTISPECIES: AtpZ/AtpI family protein [unclassified Candidatus Paralachnospira]|uniref:AtpZ/AtpI family protein n=1 Tax=unclassified Candidatus Paralachnospira TaxID=3099471 RepID=UPI003F92D496